MTHTNNFKLKQFCLFSIYFRPTNKLEDEKSSK